MERYDIYSVDIYVNVCGKTRFVNSVSGDHIKMVMDAPKPYVALYAGDELDGTLVATFSLVGNTWLALEEHVSKGEILEGHYHHFRHITNIDW